MLARQFIILTLLISLASSAIHEVEFQSSHIEVAKGDTVIVLIDAYYTREGRVASSGFDKCKAQGTNEYTHENSQVIVVDGETIRTKETFIFYNIQSDETIECLYLYYGLSRWNNIVESRTFRINVLN